MKGSTPKEMVEKITDSINDFASGTIQSDDITLLSIIYNGQAT
jgi:sigma-B regulation protein RsbU (phosphoserine phosphatase)